jgi:hypothetical protein
MHLCPVRLGNYGKEVVERLADANQIQMEHSHKQQPYKASDISAG